MVLNYWNDETWQKIIQESKCINLAKNQLGDQSLRQSSWVLMTKDVLPDSRDKTYAEQCELVSYIRRTKIPYEVPSTLAAAIAILVQHVQKGNLFSMELVGTRFNLMTLLEKLIL